jgi:hypothetical protein
MTSNITRTLIAKRQTRLKGLAVFPGIVALLFVGHAFEDAGPTGAAPYIAIALISASYVVRPMWITWLPLFATFSVYTVLVAANPGLGPASEWVVFLLVGCVPALLLWIARPHRPPF